MTTPEEKAQEIERAIAERKDADQAFSDKLDKIIDAVAGVTQRVDAIEARKNDGKREDGKGDDDNDEERAKRQDSADPRKAHSELVAAQARADSVSQMFGSQAPRPMDGDRPLAYRIRLLKSYQHNSPDFKDIDLKTVADAATFDAIEARIYADSKHAAARPMVAEGHLHEVQTRDRSGRSISKFYGEPRTWMQQFMQEPILVERINKS